MASVRSSTRHSGRVTSEESPAVRAAGAVIDRLTRLQQDFPVPGVLFRDLTPVFADGVALADLTAGMLELAGPADLYAGLEARGFVFAAAAAATTGRGMLAVRKAGKLPGAVIGEDYDLEYGTARIETHPDDVPTGAHVAVLDDVLATGGTAAAAIRLLRRAGAEVTSVTVAIELDALGGRAALREYGVPVRSLRHY